MTESASSPIVRLAVPGDETTIFRLIQELADYEKLSHEVVGSDAALHEHLFGDRPYIESFLVEDNGIPVGFALFFQNYSTTIGSPGYYLEDLFVQPEYRGRGLGKALLAALARRALDQNFSHLQWSVLDWNAPAIAFYQKIGAVISEEDRISRLTGDALGKDAQQSSPSDFCTRLVTVNDFPDRPFIRDSSQPSSQPLNAGALLGHLSEAQYAALQRAIATHPSGVEAIIVHRDIHPVGLATFTHSYSTFLTQPGLVVEAMTIKSNDRVLESQAAALNALAQLARERNCGRLEWLMGHEDESAIAQSESLGGRVMSTWRICRMDKGAIARLAAE